MQKISNKDGWIPQPIFDQIVKWVPIICVDLVICDPDEGLLLLRRAYPPCEGLWCLVGGMIKRSEQIEDAVIRHAKTETGLDVRIERLIGVYDDPLRDSKVNNRLRYPLSQKRRNITLAYQCTPLRKSLRPGPEALELKFFKRLPTNIGFDHKRIIIGSKVIRDK